MKINVPPGTKIILTIAGLLSLAGILYAANPTRFATVNAPIGVAASTTDLIVTNTAATTPTAAAALRVKSRSHRFANEVKNS